MPSVAPIPSPACFPNLQPAESTSRGVRSHPPHPAEELLIESHSPVRSAHAAIPRTVRFGQSGRNAQRPARPVVSGGGANSESRETNGALTGLETISEDRCHVANARARPTSSGGRRRHSVGQSSPATASATAAAVGAGKGREQDR